MSVLVRGMEMPENCMDCKIKQYDEYEDDCICPFIGVVCLSIGRQDACPLVEVPTPHGRLVDAGALLTERRKSKYYHLKNGDIAIPVIDIEHAPTIIEAEVENED